MVDIANRDDNFGAQIKYAIVNQWRFVDEWKLKNERVVTASRNEQWSMHLDKALREQGFMAAQREYRRRHDQGLAPVYVDLDRETLIKMREAFKK